MLHSKKLPLLLIVASVALAVLSFILLPDTVVVQLSVGGGNVTTAPKLLAVLLPTGLGVGGAVAALGAKGDGSTGGKALLVSAVGILVFIIMLAVNLPR